MSFAASLVIAMVIEGLVAWPDRLHRLIGHPVTWLGRVVDWLDRSFNRTSDSDSMRRLYGAISAISAIGLFGGAAWIASSLLPDGFWGVVIGGVIAWPLVAARSMYDHVKAVARPLVSDDLVEGRKAISMIVGRDPHQLDAVGISRAALESLAENTSDGIVAPVFWGVLLGLPGIAAYKAINTLDSMIGHRTPKHEAFGWAAARIDDVANYVPARLTALLFAVTSGRFSAALACMLRDSRHHRSPNAGWPEAAMAGALGVRLSGPRAYASGLSDEPWLNAKARDATPADLDRGLAIFIRTMLLLVVCLAILAATSVAWS